MPLFRGFLHIKLGRDTGTDPELTGGILCPIWDHLCTAQEELVPAIPGFVCCPCDLDKEHEMDGRMPSSKVFTVI